MQSSSSSIPCERVKGNTCANTGTLTRSLRGERVEGKRLQRRDRRSFSSDCQSRSADGRKERQAKFISFSLSTKKAGMKNWRPILQALPDADLLPLQKEVGAAAAPALTARQRELGDHDWEQGIH